MITAARAVAFFMILFGQARELRMMFWTLILLVVSSLCRVVLTLRGVIPMSDVRCRCRVSWCVW